MENNKEKCTVTDEEMRYIIRDILLSNEAVENILLCTNSGLKIKVLPKNHGYFNSVLPEKYSLGDWIDLKAGKTIHIKKGEYVNIPLGVAMKLPRGYEAHVLPRSSTFIKYHILMTNSMGIIDNSYSGRNDEWCFPAYAVEDTMIARGDRIAQFRIVRNQSEIQLVEMEDLTDSDRNGFGSSGVR